MRSERATAFVPLDRRVFAAVFQAIVVAGFAELQSVASRKSFSEALQG